MLGQNNMIVIIDYKSGNLRSVAGAVERVGCIPIISNRIADLEKAEKLILPGVGAFGDGVVNLRRLGLIGLLNDLVMHHKKPILGICLGAQLLAKGSEEFGYHEGLGFIDATVVKIEPNVPSLLVPHVGWNNLIQKKDNVLFKDIPEAALFYYVHSYHIKCNNSNDIVTGKCEYGIELTASFQQENVYGTQFHPEKSQLYGLYLLNNFLNKNI